MPKIERFIERKNDGKKAKVMRFEDQLDKNEEEDGIVFEKADNNDQICNEIKLILKQKGQIRMYREGK